MKGEVLKFSDALHLSWSNISQHKGRSAIVILTISILFGVVMAFNFMLEGLSKTTFDAAMQASDGKIYIAAGYNEIASINEGDYFKVNNLEDAEKAIVESVKRYHGQIIGQVVQYNDVGSSRWTINQELAERLINYRKTKFLTLGQRWKTSFLTYTLKTQMITKINFW